MDILIWVKNSSSSSYVCIKTVSTPYQGCIGQVVIPVIIDVDTYLIQADYWLSTLTLGTAALLHESASCVCSTRQGTRGNSMGKSYANSSHYDDDASRYDDDTSQYDDDTSQYDADGSQYDDDVSQYDDDTSQYDDDVSQYDDDVSQYDDDVSQYDDDGSQYDADGSQYDADVSQYDADGSQYDDDSYDDDTVPARPLTRGAATPKF
jgi:hypothetical protein